MQGGDELQGFGRHGVPEMPSRLVGEARPLAVGGQPDERPPPVMNVEVLFRGAGDPLDVFGGGGGQLHFIAGRGEVGLQPHEALEREVVANHDLQR